MGGHDPRYPYVEAHVLAQDADEAGALFFELGAQGVELRDDTTLLRAQEGTTTIIASFDHPDRAEQALAQLPAAWGPRLGEVVGDAWRDEWKKHFEPFAVCPGIVIRPPWCAYDRGPGERVIVLEPGRAFGTGLHETTRLVAGALAQRADRVRGATVLDVGCGSGILALIALELGAAAVRAIDVDPEAVAVARENAERNGRAKELRADGACIDDVREPFGLVLANLEAKTLVEVAPALTACVGKGGWLVLSGVLGSSAAASPWSEVRAAYEGLHVEEVLEEGEWLAAVLRA
jgi:ribosomal protein L11 methyltransferase